MIKLFQLKYFQYLIKFIYFRIIILTFLDAVITEHKSYSSYKSTMINPPSAGSKYIFNPDVYSLKKFSS